MAGLHQANPVIVPECLSRGPCKGCRFTWNRLLEYSSKSYQRRGESHSAFDLNSFIAHTLKPAYPWLADAPAQTLQCVSADLTSAFKAFFRKDAAYPRFKTKHRSKKSFRIP